MPESDFEQIIQKLQSGERAQRRSALQDLNKNVESIKDVSVLSSLFHSLIVIISSDQVDSFRESASTILSCIIPKLNINAEQFQLILKAVTECFQKETSEEVRLTLVKLLHSAINNQQSQEVYLSNLDPLTQLLKQAVQDSFGEVIKESCEIIVTLSETNEHFRLQADYFVEPLLTNLKKIAMKVRIPCVRALEPIMVFSPLTILNIVPQLEKSWSESSPLLKRTMVQVIGRVSQEIELEDQNFHLLPAVILLGMCNEFNEVSSEADNVWQSLKARTDFDSRLGMSFKKLIPKLLQDTEDWNNDMRIQTAQLVYQFLHEIPDRSTELPTVMEILIFQAGDDQAAVRTWGSRSARLLGETCADKALAWLSERHKTKETITVSDVTTYSQIVRGFLRDNRSHSSSTVDLCVQLAVRLSAIKDLSLLECLEVLLETNVEIKPEGLNQLLTVALSLEGSNESDFLTRKLGILSRLATLQKFEDVTSMIQQKLPALWETFEETPEMWTTASLPWKILQFITSDLKFINDYVLELLRQTISSNASPEIKLKSLNMLTATMDQISCQLTPLEMVLLANIKWKPGRSASVLRSCAALCIHSAVLNNKLEITPSNVDVYAEAFLHLVEDEVLNSRLAAIRVLRRCLLIAQPANIDSILTTMMGRLNDISKEIRHGVMSGLRDVFLHWRNQGSPLTAEKKFIDLVRVLSRDDDLPSQQYAEGILKSMLDEYPAVIDLNRINLASETIKD